MITAGQIVSSRTLMLRKLLKSVDFSTAMVIGIAITIPIVLALWMNQTEVGLAIAFGAFWSSPSDVSGSYKHKLVSILAASLLIMAVSLMGGYLHYETWLPLPILGILTFLIAYISIYGFRASLISFSGLLALVLSFANDSQELEIYQFALLTGVGGLWYLFLASLWYLINPTEDTEEVLSDIFHLTADFLRTRGNLIASQKNRKSLRSKLHVLQVELIEKHELLREILLSSRKKSGSSNYMGKRLLVFVQLVEMLETAIANPVKYDQMDEIFLKHPEFVKSFQELIYEMSEQLELIAAAGKNMARLPTSSKLTECFESARIKIADFKKLNGAKKQTEFFSLQSFFSYQEKQFIKLKKIKQLLGNPELEKDQFIDTSLIRQFMIPQDYSPKVLLRNLSWRSNIFKHSLRLSVTLMIGYILGSLFKFQNPYWILLTIIVIMRPSYGLTKARSKDRLIGTLLGATAAFLIVLFLRNEYVYGILGLLSLIIAFTMLQRNHRASATFLTLSVIFIYAIIQEDVLVVIQFRILDTLFGAILSFLAILLLWPAWGFREIRENIENAVKANKLFLMHIAELYQVKGQASTSYKVARKEAFLNTSNLKSAFQRMTQEPKSKQKDLDKIYELLELNHTFLASLASISSYVQNHQTTEASEMFKATISRIETNLTQLIKSLKKKTPTKSYLSDDELFFKQQFELFQKTFKKRLELSDKAVDDNFSQEAYLLWEQLRWLLSLSGSMRNLSSSLNLD